MSKVSFRSILTPTAVSQFLSGWIAVGAFSYANRLLTGVHSTGVLLAVVAGIIVVIVWASIGVVTQAERIAKTLGEPYGALVLTLSIVLIEVVLIAAVMLGPGHYPTIARDSVMAVSMIILNLAVGLALIIGGLRHRKMQVNVRGVTAYLALLIPLVTVGLVLPAVLTPHGSYSPVQAVVVSVLTLLAYAVFIVFQTGRQRTDFLEPASADVADQEVIRGHQLHRSRGEILLRTVLLVATMVPIVLLAQDTAGYLDTLLSRVGAPAAVSGVIIAAIVFLPETVSTVRAALVGQFQRVSNLCHGALVSTVGLTIPVVLLIGLLTGQQVVLGETAAHVVLLAASLGMTGVSFLGGRPTVLNGVAHLLLFCLYCLTVLH